MTQPSRPPAQAAPPTPPDDLVQRYHAAQAALDALMAEHAASPVEAALSAAPSAQVSANVLAYAAQLASDRAGTQDSAQVEAKLSQDNPNLIANYSISTSENSQKNHPKPAANDSQWKIKALASVAVFGLSALLLIQWDRAPSADQEVAFSTSRPTLSTSGSTAASMSVPPAAAAPAPKPAPAAEQLPPAALSKDATQADKATPATPAAAAPLSPPASPAPAPAAAKALDKPSLPQASDKAQSASRVDASARAPTVSTNNQATSRAETAVPEASSLEPGPAFSQGTTASPAPAPTPAARQAAQAPEPAPAARAAPNTAPTAAPEPAQAAGRAKYSAKSNTSSTAQSDSAKPAMGDSETQRSARAPARSDALFSAIRSKDLVALQQALANGADKNAKLSGTPALTLCVQTGQIEMVKLLAALGADVNALDAQGISALAHARRLGQAQISVVLEAYQAK